MLISEAKSSGFSRSYYCVVCVRADSSSGLYELFSQEVLGLDINCKTLLKVSLKGLDRCLDNAYFELVNMVVCHFGLLFKQHTEAPYVKQHFENITTLKVQNNGRKHSLFIIPDFTQTYPQRYTATQVG